MSNEALYFKNFDRYLNDLFFSSLKMIINLLSKDIDDFTFLSELFELIKILIIAAFSAFSLSNTLKLLSHRTIFEKLVCLILKGDHSQKIILCIQLEFYIFQTN